MKSKALVVGVVGFAAGIAFVGGCELIASVNHDDIKETSAGSTSGMGGSSSASTTVSSASTTASTSDSSSSSDASSSSTGGCTSPATCMQPTAECEEATCVGMMCGVGDKTMLTACTEGGGKVCDGAGNCVGCLSNAECAATPATPVCDTSANQCVSATCNDGQLNGTETAIDCGGGAPCAPCAVTKTCNVASDCQSGFCPAGPKVCTACTSDSNCANTEWCDSTINAGTCVPKIVDGDNCTANNQCENAHCVGNGLKVCCNTACDTTCLTCLQAEKANGTADGTCGAAKVLTDPNGDCPTNVANVCQRSTCDGTTPGGACALQPNTTDCGPGASCNAATAQFAVQGQCDGTSLTCPAQTFMDCPNHLACAGTACAAGCTFTTGAPPDGVSTNCETGFFCDGTNTCVAKLGSNATCTQHYECSSGTCNCPTGDAGPPDCSVTPGTCQ